MIQRLSTFLILLNKIIYTQLRRLYLVKFQQGYWSAPFP